MEAQRKKWKGILTILFVFHLYFAYMYKCFIRMNTYVKGPWSICLAYLERWWISEEFCVIFSNRFIANLLSTVPVKEFWKSINIWWSHDEYLGLGATERNPVRTQADVVMTIQSVVSIVCFSLSDGNLFSRDYVLMGLGFLQRVSIACYAERCLSYDRFCLTVWPSDRLSDRPSQSGIMPKRLQLRSCGLHWRIAPWL